MNEKKHFGFRHTEFEILLRGVSQCKLIYEVAHPGLEFRGEVRAEPKHWILCKSPIKLHSVEFIRAEDI